MALIKETGAIVANANCYALEADAVAWLGRHLLGNVTEWTGAATARREEAIMEAAFLIDREMVWLGYQYSPGVQQMEWPRAWVPDRSAPRLSPPQHPLRGSGLGLRGGGPYLATDAVPVAVVRANIEMALWMLREDRLATPEGEGLSLSRAADLSEKRYNKRDARPILPAKVRTMLSPYGTWAHAGTRRVERA